MAAMQARITARTGEPGRARARLAASSRRAASSLAEANTVTSCSRIRGGDLGALVLLAEHSVEGGLQVAADRRDRVLLVQERDGVFQPAPVVRQFVRGQGMQRMFRLVDGRDLLGGCGGWHRLAVPSCGVGGRLLVPNVSAREHN